MPTEKQLIQDIVGVQVLRQLARSYAEIASVRMHKTREGVISTRRFLTAIADVFADVRYSYREKIKELEYKRRTSRGEQVTFLAHNGRTVAVLLSANTGLYGEVVPETFDLFIAEAVKPEVEATIVGKMGRSLFLAAKVNLPYTYFDFPDYGGDDDKLQQILRHLVQYERVLVFYGKYQSVVSQKPTVLDVSAETMAEEAGGVAVEARNRYYFDPTIEEILMFFESEMFASLFDQAIKEGQLAKFASRMLSMDRADQNISRKLKLMEREQQRLKHRRINKKQIERMASMQLW